MPAIHVKLSDLGTDLRFGLKQEPIQLTEQQLAETARLVKTGRDADMILHRADGETVWTVTQIDPIIVQ